MRRDDDDDGMMIRNAQQCLQSLLRLHEDTYILPHRIIDGDWHNLLIEPFTKPNRKYVTNLFDEIMSRHGSVVETLADAVIMHALAVMVAATMLAQISFMIKPLNHSYIHDY